MKTKNFTALSAFVLPFSGYGKPKLEVRTLREAFPELEFTPARDYGDYLNFGMAFEQKVYDMHVTDGVHEAFLKHRQYGDADESLLYLSVC